MALRTAAAASAAPRGLRRFLSTSVPAFNFPPSAAVATQQLEQAEPSTNLFVSGLSKCTTTEKLREAFSQFGEVVHARVVTDKVLEYSKGFGFVRYVTLDSRRCRKRYRGHECEVFGWLGYIC